MILHPVKFDPTLVYVHTAPCKRVLFMSEDMHKQHSKQCRIHETPVIKHTWPYLKARTILALVNFRARFRAEAIWLKLHL